MKALKLRSFFVIIFIMTFSISLLSCLGGPNAEAFGSFSLGGAWMRFSPPGMPPPLTAEAGSPLWFPPYFGGEAYLRIMSLNMTKGRWRHPTLNAGNFVEKATTQPIAIIEPMVRIQISRFSLRLYYDFNLGNFSVSQPTDQRIEFNFRAGGDVDLFQVGRSRVGMNFDVQTDSRGVTLHYNGDSNFHYFKPEDAWTMGVHFVYNPTFYAFDWSPIFEARMRWPLQAETKLTEYDFAVGLKSPETTRGAMAFRGGYRNISLDFRTRASEFDGAWDGWFGELVYYY